MVQDSCEDSLSGAANIHPTLLLIAKILNDLGIRALLIGARSLIIHGIRLGRETKDWDVTIDKPFTTDLRDAITRELRSRDFKVQWRKWGLLVEDDIRVDINYAPLTLDKEFVERSKKLSENLLLPSLEDIIVLKLMSGEKKDITDLKRILSQEWHKLDKDYLYKRARQAGLEKELARLVRRLSLK
ncbi:DUF6036 family nucleotidyltransferase [Aeropyrum camini]|uniref:DUF6036 domain-containing protein n=1 Tax=Aeropyrum camini SY1 = JCM 12091 TaxID=1198449 RepID=U3TCZ3_9CREN|nr:DUF6036 family nucleotidyltransferase [Aeropyrum camini]BAN89843.1 hypothetical protein ACAM_0374 [Aeropyrum camini SY1 = JCM 12091]